MSVLPHAPWRSLGTLVCCVAGSVLMLAGCESEGTFNPSDPARGPGGLVGKGKEVSEQAFSHGVDQVPPPAQVPPPKEGQAPDCGAACVSYCDGLGLKNPLNQGLCQSTWGVGIASSPFDPQEACRRVFVDVLGVAPTKQQIEAECLGQPFEQVVSRMLQDQRFVLGQRKLWADAFEYDTEAVSVERIYDMDRLVQKVYQGRVSYDEFVSVASAHPVLVRRHDTSGDRAEALFTLFMGRPPLGSERSDIARLYNLWENGYYDHPQLGMRLPDSVVRYRCLNEAGQPDEQSSGPCTSILYGYNPLILEPDIRAEGPPGEQQMWSGLLKAQEWAELQLPGRLLARDRVLWEHAVDQVLEQYLGYELGDMVPGVRQRLVDTLIAQNGDIRAIHHAVLTSLAYMQTHKVQGPGYTHRWSWGPLKQIPAEAWIDTISQTTGVKLGRCDHRLNRPERLMEADTIAAIALVQGSDWPMNENGQVDGRYRDLARSLGGCPSNDGSGRFKIISILTTATQLGHVTKVCDVAGKGGGADVAALLPAGMSPDRAVNPAIAREIVAHQVSLFYARTPGEDEMALATESGEQCEREVCKAQDFARPACFALLSSAEMLFY